jgi:hypothetical protein
MQVRRAQAGLLLFFNHLQHRGAACFSHAGLAPARRAAHA